MEEMLAHERLPEDRVRKIRQDRIRKICQDKYKQRLWGASVIYVLVYVLPISIIMAPTIDNWFTSIWGEGSWTWLGAFLLVVMMITLYCALLLLIAGFIWYAKAEE